MTDWKESELIDVLDALIDYRGKTPNKTESGIPLITAKIVKEGNLLPYNEFISESDYDSWMVRGFPQKGDLVMTTEAPLGEVALLKGDKVALAQRIVTLRGKENVLDTVFLKYFLQSEVGQLRVHQRATGSTVQGIKQSELRKVIISYPSLDEQRKIADILSSLDEKIETNRNINARLEELAQAIFKSRFIDKAIYGNSTIADYLTPIRGKSLLTSDAKIGEVPVVAGGLTPATYHNESNTKAPVITISASGANAGYVNIWGCPVWSSDSSFIDNSITPYVFFWYSLLKYYQKNIFHSQTGCAQPHIYPKHIGNISIPCIEDSKMALFEKVVTPLFEKLFKNRKESARLAELRDTLLPKLMSGEIEPRINLNTPDLTD